jgi:hypothetical protein
MAGRVLILRLSEQAVWPARGRGEPRVGGSEESEANGRSASAAVLVLFASGCTLVAHGAFLSGEASGMTVDLYDTDVVSDEIAFPRGGGTTELSWGGPLLLPPGRARST